MDSSINNLWKGAIRDKTKLKQRNTASLKEFVGFLVPGVGWYYYDPFSSAVENDPLVLDASPTGKWILAASAGGGGGGGYALIQDAGTPVTQRDTLNFLGNVTVVDNPGNTRTDVTVLSTANAAASSIIQAFPDTTPLISDLVEAQLDLTIAKAYIIANITADTDCVVRVYNSQAYRTADVGRLIGDPPPLEGLVTEVELTGPNLDFDLSPHITGINLESPQDNIIPITVINNSGGNATITVTLNVIPITDALNVDVTEQSYQQTTAVIPDATADNVTFTIANLTAFSEITTDVDARVRIYDSVAARTADAARVQGDTTVPDGLVAEVDITGGGGTVNLTPVAIGSNDEGPQDGTFPAQVFNNSGGNSAVVVTVAATPIVSNRHGIQDNSAPVANRPNLNFVGFTVTDNAGNNSTDISVAGANRTSNRETLAATKNLTSSDDYFQYLDPGGAARDVVLPDPPTLDDEFRIKTLDGAFDLNIKETGAGAVVFTINAGQPYADFQYDGTEWHIFAY